MSSLTDPAYFDALWEAATPEQRDEIKRLLDEDLARHIWRPQVGRQSQAADCGAFVVGYGGAAGGGKLLPLDEVLPTPSGWKRMGDLAIGDELFDEKGSRCRVTALSDIEREPELVRFTLDDGSTIDSCVDHKWLTFDAKELSRLTRTDPDWMAKRRSRRPSRAKAKPINAVSQANISATNRARVYNIVKPLGSVRSTAEIVATLLTPGGRRNHGRAAGMSVRAASLLGAGFGGLTAGGTSYNTARDQGVDPASAFLYANVDAGLEVAGEYIGTKAFLKQTELGAGIIQRFLKSQIPELAGEEFSTVTQGFNAWVMLPENRDKSFGDWAATLPGDMAATVVQTLVAGGVSNVTISGMEKALDLYGERLRRENGNRLGDQARSAARAWHERDFLRRVEAVASDSKLRTRDPEAFGNLQSFLAQSSGVEQIYIPADAILEYQQSDFYDPDRDPFSDFSDQIEEAYAAGGDVVLPSEFAFTTLPGTKAWEVLRDDIRLTPDGYSAREADAWAGDLEGTFGSIVDDLATKGAADLADGTARDLLVRNAQDKLQNAGYTPYVARQYAELIGQKEATRAARMGRQLTGNEFDATDVVRVLPPELARAQSADRIDLVINAMRKRGPATKQSGQSLLEFIAARGGINDTGGDLKSMGLDTWHRDKPGRRKLLREFDPRQSAMGGISGQGDFGVDSTLGAAIEAGYFPDLAMADNESGVSTIDTQDLLNAMSEELGGSPRYASEPEVDGVRAAAEELRDLLEQRGLDPDGMSDVEVRGAVASLGSASDRGGFDQPLADTRILWQDQSAALQKSTTEWKARLDDLAAGKIAESRMMHVGRVPGALREFGFKGGIRVRASKIAKVAREHGNKLPLSVLENLPALLADPVAAFPSGYSDGSFVVALDAVDKAGDPVIVAVKPEEGRDGSNVVLSLYGKSGGVQWIADSVQRELRGKNKVYLRDGLGGAPTTGDASEGRSSYGPIPLLAPPKSGANIVDRAAIVNKYGRGLYQSLNDGPRGRIMFPADGVGVGQVRIELFQAANLSTLIHELGHHWLEDLRIDASDPAAPDQVKADWQTVVEWFAANGHPITGGVIPVEAHEMWARGIERHTMEGKAPSPALVRVFEAFRGWMISIYKTVEALRSPVSPEVREVMDRLIATDAEIASVRDAQSLNALFTDAKAAGMTGAEFEAYTAQVDGARHDANGRLLEKTMAAIRRRETERYRDARRTVEADVSESVDSRPMFRALKAMKETPIRKEWLTDRMGQDVLGLLPKRVPPMYRDRGAHPDVIAEMAGFNSGEEMIEALIGAEMAHRQAREGGDRRTLRARIIASEVDAEMNRRYGDPLNDGSIEREALAAVHGEMQGEVIASEIRVLGRQSGRRPTPYRLARERPAQRKPVHCLSNGQDVRADPPRGQGQAGIGGKAHVQRLCSRLGRERISLHRRRTRSPLAAQGACRGGVRKLEQPRAARQVCARWRLALPADDEPRAAVPQIRRTDAQGHADRTRARHDPFAPSHTLLPPTDEGVRSMKPWRHWLGAEPMEQDDIEILAITDHAMANAELLERVVNALLTGATPEDLGREVELIGVMMQRRT